MKKSHKSCKNKHNKEGSKKEGDCKIRYYNLEDKKKVFSLVLD